MFIAKLYHLTDNVKSRRPAANKRKTAMPLRTDRTMTNVIRPLIKLCVAIVVLLPFSLATSPEPPPYHQYSIRGVLERPSGGSKKDFAIIALGKFQIFADSGFLAFQGVTYPKYGDISIGLTDSTGTFFIRVSSATKADSLRLAVVVPDVPLTLGAPFTTDSSQVIPNTESYEVESQPGCFGCATDPETKQRITFYSYYIENRTITVSF